MNIPEHLHNMVWNILADEDTRSKFLKRPSIMLGARIFPDGSAWCCLYGDNIQEGVAGFGDSPDAASRAFDDEWYKVAKPKGA